MTVELNISCTQACVCLMFNQSKQVRFKDILETLGCTEEHLKYSITPLLYTKERFLANKGPDGKGKKELNEDGTPAAVTWDSLASDDFLAPCLIKQPKRRQIYPALKPLPPGANTPKAAVDSQVQFYFFFFILFFLHFGFLLCYFWFSCRIVFLILC